MTSQHPGVTTLSVDSTHSESLSLLDVVSSSSGPGPSASTPQLSGAAHAADDAAAAFRTTAEGETGHAHGHLEFLQEVGDPATGKPIGTTRQNLAAAIAGETFEAAEMYLTMARTAREEGFDEVADWFETLAKAEKAHAARFQKVLDRLE